MTRKFRKKPVVIEARQFVIADFHEQFELAQWCKGKMQGTLNPPELWTIRIYTMEGAMDASIGDWIIKGVKGEFYPCKPDIFELTYEEVT